MKGGLVGMGIGLVGVAVSLPSHPSSSPKGEGGGPDLAPVFSSLPSDPLRLRKRAASVCLNVLSITTLEVSTWTLTSQQWKRVQSSLRRPIKQHTENLNEYRRNTQFCS